MGASKLLCEKLVVEASSYKGSRRTKFSCVRFGNVLGSRGSVTEVFKHQIEMGKPVTVTSEEMTRFIMLLPQAINLVFKAAELAKGGEIFILKMPSLRIVDLAEVMIEKLSNKPLNGQTQLQTKFVGVRSGEKLHEELMNQFEANNSIESAEMFILVPQGANPSDYKAVKRDANIEGYLSKNVSPLSKPEISRLLKAAGII
jgi:FlaA1/EpsC-like NDP-sugar epimerase